MCGIIGAWNLKEHLCSQTLQACEILKHRGPDDSGIWEDQESGISLGQSRLSIVDLSSAGHQPMLSSDERYVIVLNGEIYNHIQLRKDLGNQGAAPKWRGHSDTETLLACISHWGFEKTLKSTVGMFAIAIWDRKNKTLFLGRDRMGEKPLYYGFLESTFAFSSEIKALHAYRDSHFEIDRDSLGFFMALGYIPSPRSIYRGIYKLLPGTWLQINERSIQKRILPEPLPYWSLTEVIQKSGSCRRSDISDTDALNELEKLLSDAVKGQMTSDVPIGAFLSGGIDSSMVVAMLQSQSTRPVETFTIGFHEDFYDEAVWAKKVAKHLGSDHTELYISAKETQDVIPMLPQIYDEPFADSSQIPTYLIAKMAKNHVTVALSGDGGDEIFGGYSRYLLALRRWERVKHFPYLIRKAVGDLTNASPEKFLDYIVSVFYKKLQNDGNPLSGFKLKRAGSLIQSKDRISFYEKGFLEHWEPEEVVLGFGSKCNPMIGHVPRGLSFVEEMMALDSLNYLPDDILVKVDRAAMAVSLETRVPFLDHRIVEFAWSLPESLKIREGQGKFLLKHLLYNYVPKELVERPKMGFGVPISAWLRGPLRAWAEDLLCEKSLAKDGFLVSSVVTQKLNEHLAGKRDWTAHLWNALMFQAWRQQNN